MPLAAVSLPVALGLVAIAAGAALAGLSAHTGWSVGVFAVLAAGVIVFGVRPGRWASPLWLALAAPAAAVLMLACWGLAAFAGHRLGWRAPWGPLPPLVLAGAGMALAIVEGRKDK